MLKMKKDEKSVEKNNLHYLFTQAWTCPCAMSDFCQMPFLMPTKTYVLAGTEPTSA